MEPRGGTSPMIALIVVERPTPLRPSRLTISPLADVEGHAMQDVALAVIGVEVLDLEQRRAHQRCLSEIGFLAPRRSRGCAAACRWR